MNKKDLAKYFMGTDGAQITSAKELITALYDGEIHIEEQMNFPIISNLSAYREANDKVKKALTEKYGIKEAMKVLDCLSDCDAEKVNYQNRFCFEQGIKIGVAVAQLVEENSK